MAPLFQEHTEERDAVTVTVLFFVKTSLLIVVIDDD
jgi:hypothetical protein